MSDAEISTLSTRFDGVGTLQTFARLKKGLPEIGVACAVAS